MSSKRPCPWTTFSFSWSFLLISRYPGELEHRVLLWGIIGALVMRAVFILVGGALLQHFHWAIYVFGGLLAVTGIKLLVESNQTAQPEKNVIVRFLASRLPVTDTYHGNRFIIKSGGHRLVTPLLMALITVEKSIITKKRLIIIMRLKICRHLGPSPSTCSRCLVIGGPSNLIVCRNYIKRWI